MKNNFFFAFVEVFIISPFIVVYYSILGFFQGFIIAAKESLKELRKMTLRGLISEVKEEIRTLTFFKALKYLGYFILWVLSMIVLCILGYLTGILIVLLIQRAVQAEPLELPFSPEMVYVEHYTGFPAPDQSFFTECKRAAVIGFVIDGTASNGRDAVDAAKIEHIEKLAELIERCPFSELIIGAVHAENSPLIRLYMAPPQEKGCTKRMDPFTCRKELLKVKKEQQSREEQVAEFLKKVEAAIERSENAMHSAVFAQINHVSQALAEPSPGNKQRHLWMLIQSDLKSNALGTEVYSPPPGTEVLYVKGSSQIEPPFPGLVFQSLDSALRMITSHGGQ